VSKFQFLLCLQNQQHPLFPSQPSFSPLLQVHQLRSQAHPSFLAELYIQGFQLQLLRLPTLLTPASWLPLCSASPLPRATSFRLLLQEVQELWYENLNLLLFPQLKCWRAQQEHDREALSPTCRFHLLTLEDLQTEIPNLKEL